MVLQDYGIQAFLQIWQRLLSCEHCELVHSETPIATHPSGKMKSANIQLNLAAIAVFHAIFRMLLLQTDYMNKTQVYDQID